MSIKKLRPRKRDYDISEDYELSVAKLGNVNAVIEQANTIIDEINTELVKLEESIVGYDRGPFQFVVKTDNVGNTEDNQFKISLSENFKYLITIDWGDGKTDIIEQADSEKLTHTYRNAGTYTIKVSGYGDYIAFWENPLKVLEIQNWGMLYLTSYQFSECRNLTVTATDTPRFGTDLSGIFRYNNALVDVPNIGNWDLKGAGVITLNRIFEDADNFVGDIRNWDVSTVKNFSYLLSYRSTTYPYSLNNWDTSSATTMQYTFGGHNYNEPLDNWDVSNVTWFYAPFRENRTFNQDISGWDVSKGQMFRGFFRSASAFNQPIGTWDVSSATIFRDMFLSASSFNQDISAWNPRYVVDFSRFLDGSAFSTENYDKLLIAWAQLPLLQPNIYFGASGKKYTSDGSGNPLTDAQAARNLLIEKWNWTFNDGGLLV